MNTLNDQYEAAQATFDVLCAKSNEKRDHHRALRLEMKTHPTPENIRAEESARIARRDAIRAASDASVALLKISIERARR